MDIYSKIIHFERSWSSVHVRVLYSDDYFFICEKPVGISSESPGLPDLLAEQTGRCFWPVHRLDTGTRGVTVLACSSESSALIQKAFQQQSVRKEYLAVVSGYPDQTAGIYTDLLFHDRKKNKSYVVDSVRTGVKKASCEWTLVDSMVQSDNTFSLIRIRLHTGRTHQIRVQFASRGYPLIGDRRYGSRIKAYAPSLWSSFISLPHPCQTDLTVEASSDPPRIFPWDLFPDYDYSICK